MAENTSRVEMHGCIVCGRLHNLLVISSSSGKMIDCMVMDSSCHTLFSNDHPFIVCNEHKEEEIKTALDRHHTGPERAQDLQDD